MLVKIGATFIFTQSEVPHGCGTTLGVLQLSTQTYVSSFLEVASQTHVEPRFAWKVYVCVDTMGSVLLRGMPLKKLDKKLDK